MYNENLSFWDNYPGVQAAIDTLQEAIKPMGEAKKQLENICSVLSSAARSYNEWITSTFGSVQIFREQLIRIGEKLAELAKIGQAIKTVGDAQFVIWEYIPDELIDKILSSADINIVLEGYISKDSYSAVYELAEKCKCHLLLQDNRKVFEQAIEAMRYGQTDLAIVGITATIDGVLSKSTGNNTTQISIRAKELLNKLDAEENLDREEYATIILFSTFEKMIATFSAFAPFNEPEPSTLNRHWIMHGRSTREKTMLDCAKLIRFLYGILLLNDLPQS